jgi:two-component system copper resistance phosphate regulon response regulator CusR
MRILIVDDDIDTCNYLKSRLEEKSVAVDLAHDGDTGSFLARTNDYDVILLDFAMPGKNGFVVCDDIRSQEHTTRKNTPIIMISVTGEVPHKVRGLSSGADDYVTKPFFFDELYARINAVMRRPTVRTAPKITVDDLVIDSDKQTVKRGSETIYLTRKEFGLLEYLARHAGEVISRAAISEHVWDMNIDPFSNTIETHILNIRKKVDRDPARKLIHSVPGRGYKVSIER